LIHCESAAKFRYRKKLHFTNINCPIPLHP
jgi:hypothetical protein